MDTGTGFEDNLEDRVDRTGAEGGSLGMRTQNNNNYLESKNNFRSTHNKEIKFTVFILKKYKFENSC